MMEEDNNNTCKLEDWARKEKVVDLHMCEIGIQ
jgi:hypothetical protein